MYNKVIFYCEFGNGDVFESREFVKALMKLISAKECLYSHKRSSRILYDITNIKSIDFNPDFKSNLTFINLPNNELAINMWIGNGKYGCLVENHYDMHNETLKKLGFDKLPGNPKDYLPVIEYSKFDIGGVGLFESVSKGWDGMILIDNGDVHSLQAKNFDFTPTIQRLSTEHPNKLFITTSPTTYQDPNIWYTGDIIQSIYDSDLMEISYLSRFCDIIAGRNSAPFVVSATKENLDTDKTFISFCYEEKVATFHVNQKVKSKQIWSGVVDEVGVFNVINHEIQE